MSDLLTLAEELGKFQDKILYLKTDPEISDFTQPFAGRLSVYGENQSLSLPVPGGTDLANLYYQLQGLAENATLIYWNAKNLLSYLKFHLPRTVISLGSKWVDLKLTEAFLGTNQSPPGSLAEALKRLVPYSQSAACRDIHKIIHKPLVGAVSDMETTRAVIDTNLRKYVYPSYEIEGQAFGRMNCHKPFDHCVLPHTLTADQKDHLKLKGEKDFFVHFDFKHMEVSLLGWLTGDPMLKLAEEADDVYRGIYQAVYGEVCDTDEKRALAKGTFLPVMFGMSAAGLARTGKVSPQTAQDVHARLTSKFRVAWDFMLASQEKIKSVPVAKDHFGRPRSFVDKPWAVRGFLVQSPSAVFCLEKLIELHKSIPVVYSIHDGYVFVANLQNVNKMVTAGLKILRGASALFPGLRLRTTCSVGVRLSQMKELPVKGA